MVTTQATAGYRLPPVTGGYGIRTTDYFQDRRLVYLTTLAYFNGY